MDKIKHKIKELKIADYFRKSSRDGEKQVASIPAQIDEANSFRENKKLPNALYSYKEERSAKTAGKRASFTELLGKILLGEINTVLCWQLNRLARNMTEGGLLIDLMSEGKLIIITFADNGEVYDETSDMSVVAQMFGASKQYSMALSRDVKRGQRTKAKSKGLPTGLATIGFKNSKQGEKGERWWLVDEERFWKVKKLLELMLTGRYSIGKLHKHAIEELKLTTTKHKKLGDKPVTREYIGKMLHNSVFAGFFFVQGERYTLDQNLPRMITESEHIKIKQLLGNRCNGKAQKHEAIYSGFIKADDNKPLSQDIKFQMWCDCRHKFAFRDKKNCPKCDKKIDTLENPEYFIQSYYYNNRKKKAGADYKSVRESDVTEKLTTHIDEKIAIPSNLLEWAKKYIYEVVDQEISDNLNKNNDLEKRRLSYEEKKKRATKLFIEGTIQEDERKIYLNDIEIEYADLKENKITTVSWTDKLNEIMNITQGISDVFVNGNFEAKRIVLTEIGANIVWNDENLFVSNKKSIEVFCSGLKSINANMIGFGNEKTLMDKGFNHQNEEFCISLRKW